MAKAITSVKRLDSKRELGASLRRLPGRKVNEERKREVRPQSRMLQKIQI